MSWAVGWDDDNSRWKGYGVPCTCEHPDCSAKIDRGMDYLCEGCGLAFCGKHRLGSFCERCVDIDDVGERPNGIEPYPAKPEHPTWLKHLRNDDSWDEWRSKPKNIQQLEAWEHAQEAKQGEQANG